MNSDLDLVENEQEDTEQNIHFHLEKLQDPNIAVEFRAKHVVFSRFEQLGHNLEESS